MVKAPLTVVVPTRDRPAMLDRCLASLFASLDSGDELIVVDSASTGPGTREVAARYGARYLRSELRGASRARNMGWRAAAHDVVAFIDDDVTVSPAWADELRSVMTDDPTCSFVVGRLAVPEGQEDGAERPVAVKDDPRAAVIDRGSRGALGHSANLAVRAAALDHLGGFDAALGAGGPFRACEDGDLIDRLLAAGHRGRYEPSVMGWHEQWRDKRALLRLDWNYGIGFGARLAKLVRLDVRRSGAVAWDFLWVWGLALVPPALRRGYKFGVVSPLLRVCGAVVGLAGAAPLTTRDGHLRGVRRR